MTHTARRALIAAVLGCASVAGADDWPQWRGPGRDGVWKETGIVTKFDQPQLPIRWRVNIGPGYCGPTVANGRVYLMDRHKSPEQIERVLCFDADTGDDVWSHPYRCEYKKVGYEAGPRASVTIDAGRAYSLGTMGHLFCLDAAKGDVLWSKDLNQEYQIRMPTWGIACAPIIEGSLLIMQIAGRDNACLVALDKISGREVWRALDDRASYSAPIIIDQASRRVVVCITGDRIVGVDARTGELYWHRPFKPWRMPITIASPVLHGNYVFISCFYDGSVLLKLSPDSADVEEIWRRRGKSEKDTDALHCCISTPILQGRHIYGVDSYGEFRCLELLSGDRVWEDLTAVPTNRWSNIHMVRNGEDIWMFNERGELIISRLAPSGRTEISRTKLIEPTEEQLGSRGGVCWSHPAYAYKRIYARNDKELVCADLAERD